MGIVPKESPNEEFGPSGDEIFDAVKHLLGGRRDLTIYFQERYEIGLHHEPGGSLIIEVHDIHGRSNNPAQNGRDGTWMYVFEKGTQLPRYAIFTETDGEKLEECALHQAPLSFADIYESLYNSRQGVSLSTLLDLATPKLRGFADINATYAEISAAALQLSKIFWPESAQTEQAPPPSFCWKQACQMLGLPVFDLNVKAILDTGATTHLTKGPINPYTDVLSALIKTNLTPITQITTASRDYILVDLELRPGLKPQLNRRYNLDEIQAFSVLPTAFVRS
jgi:hypothetical protein